jgi:HEAT repeat protein
MQGLVKALVSADVKARVEAFKSLVEAGLDWSSLADEKVMSELMADLTAKDGFARLRARWSLVSLGKKAVPALTRALESPHELRRWEAAKALSEIGDRQAVRALIKAMSDKVFDVRWLAAESLIAIGRHALAPLLKEVIEEPESIWLREGAHHVFHELNNEELRPLMHPLLDALQDPDASIYAPLAAAKVLRYLEAKRDNSGE